MKCPACQNELSALKAGTLEVDVCVGGCGGIWFDNFELRKLEQAGDMAVDLLVHVNVADRPDLTIDRAQRRGCPKCDDIVMMRHFITELRGVEVDECPKCGGYWLDAGELALTREERQAEAERRRAVEAYSAGMASRKLAELRAGHSEPSQREQTIDRLLRFSEPIRYERRPGS